jgi:excisionase family DNA binding protein
MTEEFNRATTAAMIMFEGRPGLLRVSEVAEIFGFSRASVYRLIEKGDLEVARPKLSGTRGSVRVLKESAHDLILEWLQAEDEAEPVRERTQANDRA